MQEYLDCLNLKRNYNNFHTMQRIIGLIKNIFTITSFYLFYITKLIRIKVDKRLGLMVSRKGFEPMTLRLGILRSIQLSYQD